ncbi:MAG TPA: ROK family protein [Sphingomonadaceae bacterium]|nr:ROK family protein [Sphingomonadaceae bacterium]
MASDPLPLVAGVELGGTKCLAVLARGRTILRRLRVPTGEAAATLAALSDAIGEWQRRDGAVAAIGVASFGPIECDRARPGYGTILATPKPGWAGADVRGHFARRFAVPVGFDTDVAGAALAEHRWGGGRGADVLVYLTIGTGVGGGVVVGGRAVHGLLHPEIGHVRVRRAAGDGFAGLCPFHGDCVEGLVSGPAIAARAGQAADTLPADHPVWAVVGDELAELMALLLFIVSPQRILLGGGVGTSRALPLARIRARAAALLNAYPARVDSAELERVIGIARLGDEAGPLGAVALAHDALALSKARFSAPVRPSPRHIR